MRSLANKKVFASQFSIFNEFRLSIYLPCTIINDRTLDQNLYDHQVILMIKLIIIAH